MATTINASASSGLITTADTSTILQLQTAGTAAVTVDASQNVGIGTSSPTYKLDVATAGQTIVQIKAGTTTDDSILGFGDSAANLQGRVNYSHNGDSMSFFTNGSQKMLIDSSGNVGIGTSSPTVKLDVVTASGANYVRTYNGTIDLYNGVQPTVGGALIGTVSNHPVTFFSNNAERMRIDSSGNLLVGTTTLLSGATIKGTGGTAATFATSTTANTATVYFHNGSYCGSINTSGSTTSYNTSSDYRLKENIAPMMGALATISQLNPVTYSWKSDGSAGQGFIAHELQEVVPDCVSGKKDAVDEKGNPIHQGIDTSFLVATLTAAIQELKALVDTQASTITALQADVAVLKGTP